MAVRLHRCSGTFVKLSGIRWKVQKALDDAGIEYELVKGPVRPSKRDEVERISGQRKYPVIEFEDGSAYRDESSEMAATIAAARLDEKRAEPRDPPRGTPGRLDRLARAAPSAEIRFRRQCRRMSASRSATSP